MGIIYCYTNKINGKKYIGQTINPEQRYKQHKSSAFNSNDEAYDLPLHRAFRKYGYDNFIYEVLQEAETIEELNGLEVYYIAHFNTKIPNGYNILDGGNNAPRPKTLETKIKMMKAMGKLTEEEVINLRIAYKNNESPTKIYNSLYKDRMHYNSFLNIWSGRKYKYIMPEAIQNGRHTKLTKEKVKLIREEYENNKITFKKLGEKYGVSKSTIADVINKRTWKDV